MAPKNTLLGLLVSLALVVSGSAWARPGGGQSFVGPSQQRPAPAVQPAAPAMPPPNRVAPPSDPPPASPGRTGDPWWKGDPDRAPDSTEAQEAHADDGPVPEPQEPRSRIRTNSVVFGAFMLVVAGVLLVRGVRRARENPKGPKP